MPICTQPLFQPAFQYLQILLAPYLSAKPHGHACGIHEGGGAPYAHVKAAAGFQGQQEAYERLLVLAQLAVQETAHAVAFKHVQHIAPSGGFCSDALVKFYRLLASLVPHEYGRLLEQGHLPYRVGHHAVGFHPTFRLLDCSVAVEQALVVVADDVIGLRRNHRRRYGGVFAPESARKGE